MLPPIAYSQQRAIMLEPLLGTSAAPMDRIPTKRLSAMPFPTVKGVAELSLRTRLFSETGYVSVDPSVADQKDWFDIGIHLCQSLAWIGSEASTIVPNFAKQLLNRLNIA